VSVTIVILYRLVATNNTWLLLDINQNGYYNILVLVIVYY